MSRTIRILLLMLLPSLGACATLPPESHPGEAHLIREVVAATGKSPAHLKALLAGAERQQSIIDAMNRPAESKPWTDYRAIFITDTRIADGIAFYHQHQALLDQLAKRYGVPAQYLVAILGVETNYGRVTGRYKVLDALVTLAFYYPPRARYFRKELKTLLELPADKLPGPLNSLTGSYAGAQGWGQFMPSSIGAYAVDADGDGRIDLMHSVPDILASVANYFHAHGWAAGTPVAVRARAQATAEVLGDKQRKQNHAVQQFEAWGYAPLAKVDPASSAALLSLGPADAARDWLTFKNFEVIMSYNHSPMYAMVVQQLAQAIAQGVAGRASVADSERG